jgi:hypothetical protein
MRETVLENTASTRLAAVVGSKDGAHAVIRRRDASPYETCVCVQSCAADRARFVKLTTV